MAKQKKLAIIDAHALIHRAYHALPPMSTRDGQPTNAAYGFTTMLLKVLTTVKPTHIVAAFDVKGPTFRHKRYQLYKANRKQADPGLISQFVLVKNLLKSLNIPILEKKGFEADDIIGTLANKVDKNIKKVIVTGDMDTLQLVNDHVFVFTLKRGISDTILYDTQAVQEKYGFAPEYLTDFKGLAGDSSDNIPGVPGVGEKTARDLISRYGTIENIFQHLGELPPRAQSRLSGHKKDALFSRQLATIKTDVAINLAIPDSETYDFDLNEASKQFAQLEFNSLISRLPKSTRGERQPTLFSALSKTNKNKQLTKAEKNKLPTNYHLVTDKQEQAQLLARLNQEKIIAFDSENDHLGAKEHPLIGISLAVKKGKKYEAWYIPVTPATIKKWQPLLENTRVQKTGHNLKYDYQVLAQSGITLKPIIFDSMVASYLLNPGGRQHSLDSLAVQELNHHCIPITSLIGEGRNQLAMSEVPLSKLTPYACEDAEIALRLYDHLQLKITKEGLTTVLQELEVPLIPILAKMELAGIKINIKDFHKLENKVTRKLNRLKQEIWRDAGTQFNINSTQQLRDILYNQLKLPTIGITRTQTGFSTASAELDKLHDAHPIIAKLEQYRELAKLLNTYITALPKLIDKRTGRIHASFNQTITATGRLSSANPNLQNIPIRTKLGQEIRRAFIADRGKQLVKADYSQLELRLAAHLAQDETMLQAFRDNEDIHCRTAAFVYNVDQKDVTDKQRRGAKTLNFGVLYGMGPNKFAREADVSVEEARSFIERYRQTYSGIEKLVTSTVKQAQELGFVETLFGRRRYLPEINSRSPAIRAQAERAAFNFPIQGTEADIIKKAMISINELITKNYPEADLVLSVHDELVCEVPDKQVNNFAADMKNIMQNIVTLDIPLLVDISAGPNWQQVASIENY